MSLQILLATPEFDSTSFQWSLVWLLTALQPVKEPHVHQTPAIASDRQLATEESGLATNLHGTVWFFPTLLG